MTKEQRMARIKEIEKIYPRWFLERSLHGDACEWRQLTAPNAESFDKALA